MLIQLGIAFAYGGPITAWDYFTKAVALTERSETKALCYLKLGALCERGREYQAAADSYSKAFTLPQEENELWYFLNNNLGYSLNQAGRHAEAEHYCRKAISVNPLLYNAHNNLGLSLRGQGKYREAAASFLEATKLAPGEQRAMGHLEDMFECRRSFTRRSSVSQRVVLKRCGR
jgi:tetratricopeptide (TPR) repeat protein